MDEIREALRGAITCWLDLEPENEVLDQMVLEIEARGFKIVASDSLY